MRENFVVRILNKTESLLKFPNLKRGDIGIQVGFDMSSKNLTSDVIQIHHRTTKKGRVVAIDPDPQNHSQLIKLIERNNLSITLIQKATHSRTGVSNLTIGNKSSFNILDQYKKGESSSYTNQQIEVEMDTLDHILKDLNIDYSRVKHICITNNGAEYDTLLGMQEIFEHCYDLSLTIASGRPNALGEINGRRDYEIIIDFLTQKGFKTKLIRLNHSFWRGIVVNLISKRKWVFGKKRYGFIMASRGKNKLKFYQYLY